LVAKALAGALRIWIPWREEPGWAKSICQLEQIEICSTWGLGSKESHDVDPGCRAEVLVLVVWYRGLKRTERAFPVARD